MKQGLKVAALLGFLMGSASLYAGEAHGPVLKVKPQGATAGTPASKPGADAPGNVKNSQGNQPAGLLLPAVQKAREAAPRSQNANGQDTGISGGLDRDIIPQIPGKPKPTK